MTASSVAFETDEKSNPPVAMLSVLAAVEDLHQRWGPRRKAENEKVVSVTETSGS